MRRFLIGLGVTGVSVALLWRLVDVGAALDAMRSAEPKLIIMAVVCLMASIVAKTARWRLLLPSQSGVTTPGLYRILHISFLLNNVLPARVGDVARVALTSQKQGVRSGHVLSSLLTERVTDTVTLLAGFVVVSPFLPLPTEYIPWLHGAWAVLALATTFGVLVFLMHGSISRVTGRFPLRRFVPKSDRMEAEARSFQEGWRQLFSKQHVVGIWVWSWTAWVTAFGINYLLMRALHIDAPFAVAVLLTCTTNLAMLIPSSPGYVGVFHAAATLSLAPFHVAASAALSFAILAHLVNVVPVSVLGAGFLLLGHDSLKVGFRQNRSKIADI